MDAALGEDGVEVRVNERRRAIREWLESFDRLLVATGRQPNADGLDALGLDRPKRGIEVDERMRAAENVWAIGDVTGIALFTHVGKYHARIAAYDMTGRDVRADHRAIPATIFTDPQVATVGTLDGQHRALAAHLDAAPLDLRAAEARRVRQDRRRPRAARPHRRRRRRARGRRMAPAAHARDPRRDADRGPARRDPALPDLQRGGLPRAARAEPRPMTFRLGIRLY